MHYVKLFLKASKLRVIELIFTTMIPSITLLLKSYEIQHALLKVVITAGGGVIAAMGAGALNNYLDKDIDPHMSRTKKRVTASGEIPSRYVLFYGLAMVAIGIALYLLFLNLLATLLLGISVLIYSFFYTLILKRSTWQNIVWGGLAGAFPPIIASAGLIDRIDMVSLLLGLIVFFWTPVHYWPLSYYYLKDYEQVKVPMLPVVKSMRFFKVQIMLYYVYMVAMVFLIPFYKRMNILSLLTVAFLSFLYVLLLINYIYTSEKKLFAAKSIKMFHYSIYYLFFLFVTFSLDFLLSNNA